MTTPESTPPAVQAVPEIPSYGSLAPVPDPDAEPAAGQPGRAEGGAVTMSALLQSCAAATAVSTPPELPTPRAA